ncbi:unnamed protein product [Lymnaea stagnalis]|uniref:G-protein coupled receptors family 1 profile domain-containing protein n=1 Tax=Lymnaea stagnalis TaxID=6523 RepID=A0AAV2IH10_LYMST
MLMTSMATSDFLIGAIIMPMATSEMVNNGRWTLSPNLCRYRALIDVLLCTVSIYHVFFMAVDRYIAVCKPLIYHKLTHRAGVYMVAFCWIFPHAFFACPIVFGWAQANVDQLIATEKMNFLCILSFKPAFSIIGSLMSFFAPFAIVFVLYFLILVQVRRFQKGRIKKFQGNVFSQGLTVNQCRTVPQLDKVSRLYQHTPSSNNICNGHSGLTAEIPFLELKATKLHEDAQTKRTSKENMNTVPQKKLSAKKSSSLKAYRTIGLIVIIFTVCWLPLAVFQSVINGVPGLEIDSWTVTALAWLGYLNSAFNPLLFCCHRSVRDSVRRLFCLT